MYHQQEQQEVFAYDVCQEQKAWNIYSADDTESVGGFGAFANK